ncbi:MAG: 30S ribosomal protein S4 [Candidatus Micrarchaeaceae archaeon]
MGSPRRLRKKYEAPSIMWNNARITQEHDIKAKYGLKTMHEEWLAESELRRIRKNVREILAGRQSEETGKQIIRRLASYGIVSSSATLDELLSINVDSLLSRRLQSVIVKKGMARTLRQARQLITHGFISINGRKVTVPGYLVKTSEESAISYYKPIDINAGVKGTNTQEAPEAPETTAAQQQQQHEQGEVQDSAVAGEAS